MMFIGCAICLARDSDSVAVKWETGVLVMFVLLFFFGILSAIVTGLFKCKGKIHLIVVIVWDVVTILVALATLIWTLINMRRCRSYQTSGDSREWSWEIFLIALGIALFVFVLLAILWYIRRKKHCKCCGGTTRWDCHFSSRSCCSCCNHGSRERIRVESAEINRHHTKWSTQNGCACCFCGCCKRKIGDNPELGSQTHHRQTEHRKTHGVRGTASPERMPTEATVPGHHYKRNDHYQKTKWVCCPANACCKRRPKDDTEHISGTDNERDDDIKHGAHRRPIEQTRIRDERRYREPTVWVCCPQNSCCSRKPRGEQEPISESEAARRHRDNPSCLACCGPRSCCKGKAFDPAALKWETPDTSCGKCCQRSCGLSCFICCCTCCKSCKGKGKKKDQKKGDKKPDAKNEKNKEKADKSKDQKKAKDSDDEKDDKIKAEKEGKSRNKKKSDDKAESDDDKDEKEKDKNGKERSTKDQKKHGKPADDSDTDGKRGSEEQIRAKNEDKLLRGKVDKEPLIPPLFGSIELQENSQRQVKRFLPPKRVLAASVVGDDRSLTPVTPGRDSSPERLGDSPRKDKKPYKNKEESKDGKKKNTHREELGGSTRL